MRDTRVELTAVLRERDVLDAPDHAVVAWRGWLVEFDEVATAPEKIGRPPAVLGVSRRSVHLLSRSGLVSVALATTRAYADGRGLLEVSGRSATGARTSCALVVAWPVLVANQLNDMARAAITGRDAEFADAWSARRMPAKQR